MWILFLLDIFGKGFAALRLFSVAVFALGFVGCVCFRWGLLRLRWFAVRLAHV